MLDHLAGVQAKPDTPTSSGAFMRSLIGDSEGPEQVKQHEEVKEAPTQAESNEAAGEESEEEEETAQLGHIY